MHRPQIGQRQLDLAYMATEAFMHYIIQSCVQTVYYLQHSCLANKHVHKYVCQCVIQLRKHKPYRYVRGPYRVAHAACVSS